MVVATAKHSAHVAFLVVNKPHRGTDCSGRIGNASSMLAARFNREQQGPIELLAASSGSRSSQRRSQTAYAQSDHAHCQLRKRDWILGM
eukprot:9006437-Pyramimonas_sp.AAC.1